MALEERIKELVDYLHIQRKKYYEGEIEISDEEFNALEEELRSLDSENEYFKEVGSEPDTDKIKHSFPMRSIQKKKSPEKVTSWLRSRMGDAIDVIIQPKIDGVSLTNRYEERELIYSATRGDGEYGKEITEVIQLIEEVPKATYTMDPIEIRGEVYLEKDAEYSKQKAQEGKESLRNIAAGILNRKQNIEDAVHLNFVAYDIIGVPFPSELDKLEYLQAIVPNPIIYQRAQSVEEVAALWEQYNEEREILAYEIDGIVIKINDGKLREQYQGTNPHHWGYEISWTLGI